MITKLSLFCLIVHVIIKVKDVAKIKV